MDNWPPTNPRYGGTVPPRHGVFHWEGTMQNAKKRRNGPNHAPATTAAPPPVSGPSGPQAIAPTGPSDHLLFDLETKRTRLSNQLPLDQVRAFAATVGNRAFRKDQFDAWPDRRCRSASIAHRFGSWRAALAAAGIHGARVRRYSAQELIERLETAWRAVGRRPGHRALRAHAGVTPMPYRKRWGTYMRACTLFSRFKRGQITLKEFLRPRASGLRKPISPRTRWIVLNRDQHRCRSCGRGAGERGVKLEVDHIVPVSAGGSNALSNLRTLCLQCNRGKGGKPKPRLKKTSHARPRPLVSSTHA